ncbi:DnaA regulatory inactivator HdaA [Mesorhizobium sp. LHD-90]|uniref:DnaA regulatory inactivator HdaA n=1 Tax=Mesorhizobium sp. LHD-90 TaxID=3071414 RepID=UPI0027E003EB|nr:DnaA regulatory inactivator HdaA [Mesorhizobium sp. LHD-90]MDQ6434335.1 DnaA regulatory inactivator HdaA [Mesorhizobium sp. LHD-90]
MRKPEPPRQLPLDLGHAPGLSRDDLIVSAANRDAAALIERWPDWPSPVVVLAGPPGSGKSHLAEVWREMSGAESLSAGKLDAGASGWTGLAYLVEDADAPGLDQTGLFHLINAMRAGGGHLLLTARRFAPAWGIALPDLASRLKAATTVEIHEPDDLLLAGVITKLFADRQVEVEANVVQFLVRRIERSLSAAIQIVDRLDRTALERKARITRAMAAELTAEIEQKRFEF